MGKTIVITDDASFMRKILSKILIQQNYEIIGQADSANAGIEAYKRLHPDLITMDICMPNKSGLEAIHEIIDFDPDAKILVVSALGQELLVMEAIEAGAKDFVVKPFKKEEIIDCVRKILE
ncbi:MAG: response regulator [Promethearchaeota archaeon]